MPAAYSNPSQSPHKYFKYLLVSFKKEIINFSKIEELEEKMQAIINAAKDLTFIDNHKKNIFHKPEAEKILDRIFSEFKRYITTLKKEKNTSSQDLLKSIEIAINTLDNLDF